MKSAIRWKRSVDGAVDSHDGQWSIEPMFLGCTKPQLFRLYLVVDGKREDLGTYDTQTRAKDRAASYGRSEVKS